MKTFLPCLIVPALLAGVGYCLHAQDAGTPATGKVLLLKNGQVMEGDIERIGTQMRIRKGASEIYLAADLAARLCADWDDAYLFMQTLIKPESAGDRVKLARWCNMHHLNDKALEQAKLALALEPSHAGAKQIVTLLERSLQPIVKAPAPVALPVSVPVKMEPTSFVDVTAETSIAYTTRVQPILMNACATCHTNGAGGKFVLERVSEGGQKVRTQHNLAAVLAIIDLDRPSISPLLVKAVTPHGGATAAGIRDRSAKPFAALKDWIDLTVKSNPQLKDYQAARKGMPKKSAEPRTGFGSQQSSAAPTQRDTVIAVQRPQAPQPARARDWCDPDIFNDWAHPRVVPQQTANSRP